MPLNVTVEEETLQIVEEEPQQEITNTILEEDFNLLDNSIQTDISSTSSQNDSKFTCLLVRHAESEHNVRGIRAGARIDSELTVHGYNQAKKLAKSIRNLDIVCVYSSPQKRAKRTAEEITKVANCPLYISDFLVEKDLGSLEGTSFRYTANYRPREPPMKVTNLESRDSLLTRARGFTDILFNEAIGFEGESGKTIVVVSHGIFLPFLLRAILARARTPLPSMIIPWNNASYCLITIDLGGNSIVKMNCNSHLRGIKRTRKLGSSTYDSKQKPITEFCSKLN
ncbi:Phosphoglycerate mutase family protein [Schizosaccharomyces pombe]